MLFRSRKAKQAENCQAENLEKGNIVICTHTYTCHMICSQSMAKWFPTNCALSVILGPPPRLASLKNYITYNVHIDIHVHTSSSFSTSVEVYLTHWNTEHAVAVHTCP